MAESSSDRSPADPGPGPGMARRRTSILLFVNMSTLRQVWESLGGAVVTGAGCGVLLGFTVWGYLAGVLVSFLGGFPAGSQHRTLPGALTRGFVGGSLWASAVLVAIGLSGRVPTVPLPEAPIAFLPWGFVPACIVAATSWLITRRRNATSRG